MRDYSPFERYRRFSEEYSLNNCKKREEKIRISYQLFLDNFTSGKVKIVDATDASLEEKI